MKKLFLLLLAAILLPLTVSAQPHQLDLQPNQLLMGHYTTDDLTLGGCWGKSFLRGTRPIATDLTPDELALFQGSKIVAFRVGLSLSTDVTRVFVIPVAPNGDLGEEVEWPCQVSDEGWNLVELDTPYEINLPDNYSLRIGFDYEQVGSSKPISAVKVGTVYSTLCYFSNKWSDYGVNVYGNLSLQCICENDNFPEYIIRMKDLTNRLRAKIGDDINFSFKISSLGTGHINPGDMTFNISVDGQVVKTMSNPIALGSEYTTISGVISTDGFTPGAHTLTVSTATLNGEPLEEPQELSSQFQLFEFGFSRQMHLVEQFTSTGCTWCPTGSANLQNLCQMRNDVAWVGVHVLFGSPVDPFAIAQSDTLQAYQGVDGYPEGTFDRSMGIGNANELFAVLSGTTATTMSNFFDHLDEEPSWATVNVNSQFDAKTRNAVITIDGELVPNYEDFMGNDSKLTVYITEDNLVAAQVDQGVIKNDYVHNGVLRKALVSVKGVALNKDGDTYKNEFTYTIPNNWNAENLNIVAFISRPLGNAITDLYVTNCNKRKLGEFDEPTIIPGDVNGDEIIGIDDVTAIVDLLFNGVSEENFNEGADVDSDGFITIDDVTALVDLLLSGNK